MINIIKLAKQSIKDEFAKKETKIPLDKENKELKEKRGCFVTLTKHGELRGCIGFPYPVLPLAEAIIKSARAAAFSDPRFPPLSQRELPEIRIEISILSLPEKINARGEKILKCIKIGKDGLMCEYEGMGGLLLPQVATEHKMNSEQFLRALCEKSGLNLDTWKDKDFRLWKFQAEIIKE